MAVPGAVSWWVFWLLVGVILLGIELLSATFFLLWVACAAFIAALMAAFFPGSPWVSGLAFVSSAVVLVIVTRPLARRIHRGVHTPSTVDGFVGEEAVVIDTIGPDSSLGRVRVQSGEWRARCAVLVEQGARVRVRRVEGATLVVEPLDSASAGIEFEEGLRPGAQPPAAE